MIRTSLILILILFSSTCFSQGDTLRLIPKYQQKGFLQLDFLPIRMPNGERDMGLSGVNYNLNIGKLFYGGVGFYGAVSGIRGGFFTLGVNAGLNAKIANRFFFDTGVHFGGGGGASAPEGGGAMILSHANLAYKLSKFSIFSGYSYINFFNKGDIKSSQINFGARFPLQSNYTDFSNANQTIKYNDYQNSTWNIQSKDIEILLHFNNLSPKKKSRDLDSTALLGKQIHLAGIELNSFLAKNTFFFIKADASYMGYKGGYMDILLGAGHRFSIYRDFTKLAVKFGLGAGGGGGIDTQGGFLIYPDISVTQKICNNFSIHINKGFLLTPNRHFIASNFGVGLQYHIQQGGLKYDKEKVFDKGVFKGLELTAGQEVYFKAAQNDTTNHRMQQILVQVNYYLKRNIYIAGQTAFANFGKAGAYAEGIFGIGITTENEKNRKLKGFVQVLAGAAGGGDIAVGEGLIVKPSIGLQYQLHRVIDLRTSFGRTKALDGNLSTNHVNFGVTYKVALLQGK